MGKLLLKLNGQRERERASDYSLTVTEKINEFIRSFNIVCWPRQKRLVVVEPPDDKKILLNVPSYTLKKI